MHLKNKDSVDVYQLSSKVSSNLLINKSLFPDADPPLEVFNGEIVNLNVAITAKDGSKQKKQAADDQTVVVFDMLKSQCIYVNKIAKGDRNIILLSGFDCNNEPTYRTIPDKALIKRIEDGSTSCSAKIFVVALTDADRYKVEISYTPADPASWKTVLDYGVLNKMEIRGLNKAQEVFIRVTGGNSKGWGIVSEMVSFIPR